MGKRNTAQKYFATIDTGKTIYVLERNVIEDLDKPAAEFRSKQLANVDKAAIAVIKITHGKESLTLSKVGETGGGWIITAPLPARADSKLVDDIVYQLANGKADEFTELAPSSAIGLTAPQLTIQAFAAPPSPPATTTASSQPAPPPAAPAPLIALQIGSYSDPLNKDKVYAVLAGSSEVFTLPADAFSKFNKSLNDLIDHSVFASTAGVAEATLLSIEPANGPQSPIFLRKEADSWNLRFANPAGTAEAPGLAGDPAAVAPLLESLKNLRASKIVTGAGDLKAIGLDPPTLTVTLQLPRAISTTTLLAGKEQKDPTGLALTPVMIRGEQTVYMIGSDELKPILAANPLELRSKTVADFVANDIESITIEHWGKHGKLITLTRDQAKWSLRDSGAANNYAPNAADAGKVTSLLAEFNPLTAAKWLSNGVAELNAKNPPEITVTLAVSKEVLGPPAPPPTHPATSSQPSTTSAPAPAPPTLPRGPAVTHTLELFSRPAPATAPATSPATSPATTSAPAVLWTARLKGVAGEFEPTPNLIEYLTKTTYRAPPAPPSPAATTTSPAATDPATTSATTPAK